MKEDFILPLVIVTVVLVFGAYMAGRSSIIVPQSSQPSTPADQSAEVQHLEARIADCQNEIDAADNSIYQGNLNLIQAQNGVIPYSSLKTQKQVNDLLDSVGGNTLCFEDDTAQYNQSNALNTSQQQDSLVTP